MTVAELIERLQKLPPHFKIDFNPNGCDDVVYGVTIEVLEGSTSDGPGSAWVVLIEDEEDEAA